MGMRERDREIRRRRQHRLKVEYLRRRIAETKDAKVRAALQVKLQNAISMAGPAPK